MFDHRFVQIIAGSLGETLYMVGVSCALAVVFGLPIGVVLVTTERKGILENPGVNQVFGVVVNIGRSIPFVILMVAIMPFTRLLTGTSIGTTAAIVPLTVAAIPFVARMVETSLREVDQGVIEAAQAMGASPWEIISKVLIPEAMPSLISGVTITAINLIGYSTMAGAIGGGGLGDLAVRYGYQRFRGDVMFATVVILVLLVQGVQMFGGTLARRVEKRRS
ncbi:MAG TPA: methionine ABC transporter permease [Bacillota bacterium]|nr:methionine ABC transporter permease [Bacillota bacterium]HOJ58414.1 methionine ABC transporter permease [Bacillota bacterium]HOL02731.1 methionine ABC transporter permease [Bacillota bacterium]HPO80440.1 methionine ABC transporter permease [Bacillota bacterium]HPZ91942.1 methionine ABC transporter permease [Bacillota bacterium]